MINNVGIYTQGCQIPKGALMLVGAKYIIGMRFELRVGIRPQTITII
jgi:hypothetical protein